jgi:hypothetical protein
MLLFRLLLMRIENMKPVTLNPDLLPLLSAAGVQVVVNRRGFARLAAARANVSTETLRNLPPPPPSRSEEPSDEIEPDQPDSPTKDEDETPEERRRRKEREEKDQGDPAENIDDTDARVARHMVRAAAQARSESPPPFVAGPRQVRPQVATAEAIVRAAAKARNETPLPLSPVAQHHVAMQAAVRSSKVSDREMALRIVNAGRVRRGEEPLTSLPTG